MAVILVCDLCGKSTDDTIHRSLVEVATFLSAHMMLNFTIYGSKGHMCRECWKMFFLSLNETLDRTKAKANAPAD